MANEVHIINDVHSGLDTLNAKLAEIDVRILSISKSMRSIPKQFFDAKTPRQVNEAIKERSAQTEKLSIALKEQDRVERRLLTEIERKKLATEATNRALAKERFEHQQTNRVVREQTVLNSKLATEYQKLVARMNKAGRVVQNLTAKKESGVRLSNKEQRELKQSQREFKRYNRAVLRADKSIGRFQRNVGNYSSALGKASLALKRFLPIFGASGAFNISRQVYRTTKSLEGVDKALRKVTGTQQEYNRAQEFTIRLSEEAGVEVLGLQKSYVKFLASAKTTNLTTKQTENIFRQTAKAGAVLGLSTDDMNGAFRALEQILSKGNVQAEEIRGQLGERLPGAFQILAKSMGLTTQELNKQLELGNVISEEVLPGFAEEIERTYGLNTVKKVETLSAAQNRLSNAWTEFIRGLEGGEGLLSNFFKAGLGFATKFLKVLTPLNNASERQLKLIQDEQVAINSLVARITDVNIKNEDRQILLDTLIKQYPTFNKFLGDEETTNENLVGVLDEVNQAYIKRIVLQKQQAKIEELLGESADLLFKKSSNQLKIDEELARINSDIFKNSLDLTNESLGERVKVVKEALSANADYTTQLSTGLKIANNLHARELDNLTKLGVDNYIITERQTKAKKELSKEEQKLKDLEGVLGTTLAEINALFEVNTNKNKENKDAAQGTIAALEEKIKVLREEQKTMSSTSAEYQVYEKQIIELQKAIDKIKSASLIDGTIASLEQRIKTLREEQSTMAVTSEHYQRLEDDIIKIQEAINGFKTLGLDDLSLDGIDFIEDILSEDELNDLNAHIQNTIGDGMEDLSKIVGQSAKSLFSEFNELYDSDYQSFQNFSNKKIEQFIKEKEQQINTLELIGEALSKANDISDAFFERRIQGYDDEIQKNNDYYAALLDNETLSEEQRSALEAQRDRKNAELEKKKRDTEIKQAKLNKAFQVLEITIDTAKKVAALKTQAAVLASNPVTLPLVPQTLASIPPTIAFGAAAVAAVLAQPIPKYRHGRMGGKEEFAIVGDGGKQELIERMDGSQFLTPSKPTLTYLQSGDKVFPDAQKHLSEQAYKSALHQQDRQLDSVMKIDVLGQNINAQTKTLVKAMEQNRTKLRVHIDNKIGDDLNWISRQTDVL